MNTFGRFTEKLGFYNKFTDLDQFENKEIMTWKNEIANQICKGYSAENERNARAVSILERIYEDICFAWDNFDDNYIAQFFIDGNKPSNFTEKFASDWVENQDFEADGYDEEYLKEIFG